MPNELVFGSISGAANGHTRSRRRRDGTRALERLMQIIQAVKAWAVTVEDRLLKAYLVAEEGGFRLYAVARSKEYDFELTKSLTNLSIELSDAGLDLGVSQVPDGTPEELQAFFDPAAALALSWR
jgi:hypothetical protein